MPIKGGALFSTSEAMKTVADYRKLAEDCRAFARQMPAGKQREQLLKTAKAWDSLGDDRETLARTALEPDTAIMPQPSKTKPP